MWFAAPVKGAGVGAPVAEGPLELPFMLLIIKEGHGVPSLIDGLDLVTVTCTQSQHRTLCHPDHGHHRHRELRLGKQCRKARGQSTENRELVSSGSMQSHLPCFAPEHL